VADGVALLLEPPHAERLVTRARRTAEPASVRRSRGAVRNEIEVLELMRRVLSRQEFR